MDELVQRHHEQSQLKDPYKTLMLQGETLDVMKDVKEQIREELSLMTPKSYRNQALSLFRSIEPMSSLVSMASSWMIMINPLSIHVSKI